MSDDHGDPGRCLGHAAGTSFDWVTATAPFPIAVTYSRYCRQAAADVPVASAWALKDCFEATFKLLATLAVADFRQAEGDNKNLACKVLRDLQSDELSFGTWVELCNGALKASASYMREGSASPYLLKELGAAVFCLPARGGPVKTQLYKDLTAASGVVNWRNTFFGHGVFRDDPAFYVNERKRFEPLLHGLFAALRPLFEAWRLLGVDEPDGIDWTGEKGFELPAHDHAPSRPPSGMRFVRRDGGGELALGPLISVQPCAECRQPVTFFFDKFVGKGRAAMLLEYLRGHSEHSERVGKELAALQAGIGMEALKIDRTCRDASALDARVTSLFSAFDDYIRPDYLMERLLEKFDLPGGFYLHVVGQEGVGKSFLARALVREFPQGESTVAVAYHVTSEASGDLGVFIDALGQAVNKDRGKTGVYQIQTKVSTLHELQEEMVRFLSDVLDLVRGVDRIVIVIDALDQLPEAAPNSAAITDLLPDPHSLPTGCFVVLTSRPVLRGRVSRRVEELSQDGDRYFRFDVDPVSGENRALVRRFLEEKLPERTETVDAILKKSGSVFLYGFHLWRGLVCGAFDSVDSLPDGKEFYKRFLQRLRERAGEDLFERHYIRPLMILAALQQPVTMEFLERLGVRDEDFEQALLDVRDFLRSDSVASWHETLDDEEEPRFELAHPELRRFFEDEPEYREKLEAMHRTVARRFLESVSGAAGHGEIGFFDLYALRFVRTHLRFGGMAAEDDQLTGDMVYAEACVTAAERIGREARLILADELLDRAIEALDCSAPGRAELVNREILRVDSRRRKVDLLLKLGRDRDALVCADAASRVYEEAVQRGLLFPGWMEGALLVARGQLAMHQRVFVTAAAVLEKAIEILDLSSAKDESQTRHVAGLGILALRNLGMSQAYFKNYSRAIDVYDEALQLIPVAFTVARDGPRWGNETAMLLNNKAIALRGGGDIEGAEKCHREALAIRKHLVRDWPAMASGLAISLTNHACTLQGLERHDDALAEIDEACSLRRELYSSRGTQEGRGLAFSLGIQGQMLARLRRHEEAITLFREASGIRRELLEKGLSVHSSLATSLQSEAHSLESLGRLEEALERWREAIALRASLVEVDHPSRPLIGDLARSRRFEAALLLKMGRRDESLATAEEAVSLGRRAVEGSAERECQERLAGTLRTRGNVYREHQRLDDARRDHEESVQLFTVLVSDRGAKRLASDLASSLEALSDTLRAISERTGPEVLHLLLNCETRRALLASERGKPDRAAKAVGRAFETLERARASGDRPDCEAEWESLLDRLRALPPAVREALVRVLPENLVALIERPSLS